MFEAFVYGCAVQKAVLPFDKDTAPEISAAIAARFSTAQYPHLFEFATDHACGARFEVAAGRRAWLESTVVVGSGQHEPDRVMIDLWEVR